MNSSSSGKRLERFFTGKGFYIVLFLCAAVIGVSAWMMAAGNVAMDEHAQLGEVSLPRTQTVIVPASAPESSLWVQETLPEEALEVIAPAQESEIIEAVELPAEPEAALEAAEPGYIWPVSGDIDRAYHIDQLRYDPTMCDWRTHDGIDIEAPVGSSVFASRSGMVAGVEKDDLYGTRVLVDHGDGTGAIYANLADVTAVEAGQWVETGAVLGSVGDTAICESAQSSHLHFAMRQNGLSADPLGFLNA